MVVGPLAKQDTIRDDEDVRGSVLKVPVEALNANEAQPAVTDSLESSLLFGVSAHSLDLPLWPYCLHIPCIGRKKRALSNSYRSVLNHSTVIEQQQESIYNL